MNTNTESYTIVCTAPVEISDDFARAARDLSAIVDLADKNPQLARFCLSRIDIPEELISLQLAVHTHVVSVLHSKEWGNNESKLQKKFFASLESLIPGAKQVFIPFLNEHIPDGFVEINGCLYVVEVKRDKFTAASLRQIQRYISEYGAHGGIAVAPALRCPIPSNVRFVSLSIAGDK